MPIGVIVVRFLARMVAGEEDNEIRKEVRQRMDAIGDQALGVRKQTCHHLDAGEQKVDRNADPGAACRRARPLLRQSGVDFIIVKRVFYSHVVSLKTVEHSPGSVGEV